MSIEVILGIIAIIPAIASLAYAAKQKKDSNELKEVITQQKREQEEREKKEREEKDKPLLNVIAWDGIGDPDISKKFSIDKKIKLNCLEYERGITGVTKLRMEERPFDVAVIDREFLTHFNHGKIKKMESREFDNLWPRLEQQWREIPESLTNIRMIPDNLGIPIRCGLNAILVNSEVVKEVNNKKKITSYDFLSFSNLQKYDTDLKIILWNWYLPSLCVLLLANDVKINDVFKQGRDKIKNIIDGLESIKGKIKLCNKPKQVHQLICSEKAWIVPGGGGWLLPLESVCKEASKWEVVVPQEGAFLWVECACILDDSRKPAEAITYVEFLLEEETQRMICRREGSYQACPSKNNSIRDIGFDMLRYSDKLNIFDGSEKHKLKKGLEPRPLPIHWRIWEEEWEGFVNSLGREQWEG